MRLVDQLLGAAGAGAHQGLAESVIGMLAGGQGGGLQGLVKAFGDKGLGGIVGSWVGTGSNLPVSPQQIQEALGSQQLQHLGAQHGMDIGSVAAQLAQQLPGIVDRLTPGGSIPDPGSLQGLLKGLLR
jgi:uncharacterized protein YidB (DUF937 family)